MASSPNNLNKLAVFRQDFLASLVVFLVALPLCIAIANASGMPSSAGVLTGVIGGLIVGLIAGSPLQVSGPAAGLIVLCSDIIQRFGFALFGLIVLIAGLMQVMAGLLKWAQWFRAVSPAVIQGMLAGIGALIMLGQLHVMVDDLLNPLGRVNFKRLPFAIWETFSGGSESTNLTAGLLGLGTIAIIVFWSKLFKKSLLPPSLIAVVAITTVCFVFGLEVQKIDVSSNWSEAIRWVTFDSLKLPETISWGQILVTALAVSFIASAESLLCATAADQLHQGPRTDYDRELVAQGVGNTLCGICGIIPMTGVIVRTGANISAGAKSRWSAVMHGVWLFGFVSFFPDLLNLIPKTCLAAILVYTGWKLINVPAFLKLWKFNTVEALICLATFATIVGTDLLKGVILGIILATLKLLYTFSHLSLRLETGDPDKTILQMEGSATFLRLPHLAKILAQVSAGAELHVPLENLYYIDHACLELLGDWAKQHEITGGKLVVDWESLHAAFRRNGKSQ